MGAACADKLDYQLYTDPIMEKFAALKQESVFDTLWTRPGLDLKAGTAPSPTRQLDLAQRKLFQGMIAAPMTLDAPDTLMRMADQSPEPANNCLAVGKTTNGISYPNSLTHLQYALRHF